MQENLFKTAIITRKLYGKVKKPHFKRKKALFKRGQKETVKTKMSQNSTQKKMVGLFLKKDYPFNYNKIVKIYDRLILVTIKSYKKV